MSKEGTTPIPEIMNLDMLRDLNKRKIRIFAIPTDQFPLYEEAAEAADLELEDISDTEGDLFLNADFIKENELETVKVRLDTVKPDTIVFSIGTPEQDDYELFAQTLDFLRQAQRRR